MKGTTSVKMRHDRQRLPAFYILDPRYGLYVEDYFKERLYQERKRSERTNQPFVLMLIDVKDVSASGAADRVISHIASLLLSSTRETDVKGWYKCGTVIGVLFTGSNVEDKISSKICRKINDHLHSNLPPGDGKKVRISFHLFPGGYQQGEKVVRFDLYLYPDLTTKQKTAERVSLLVKRFADVGGALLALAVLSPLLLLIPLLIKLSLQEGAVLSKEERIGRFGIPFYLYKFCFPNGHAMRCLERTGLDRLPLFFNVIKGDLSLVGPRALRPAERKASSIWSEGILGMRPGLTGPSRLYGSCDMEPDEAVRLDLKYVRQWSLWLDMKILLKTVSGFRSQV